MSTNGMIPQTNANPIEEVKENNSTIHPVLSQYGCNVFSGYSAAPYLAQYDLSPEILNTVWTSNRNIAEKVASALVDWAYAHHANYYGHWCHPLGSNGVRYGGSAIIQRSLIQFDHKNNPHCGLNVDNLIRDDVEVSCYPTGGFRKLHRGGGFVTLDVNSPIFVRDDTVYLPACISAYNGYALDENSTLLRAISSITKEGKRLLKLLGREVEELICTVGIEQDFFLIRKDTFCKRLDFELAGRAVLGRMPPRGHDLRDQYAAPIPTSSAVMNCLKDVYDECVKLGIPITKRLKEISPHQYQISIHHCDARLMADKNLLLNHVIEECAEKHSLAALFNEKPFRYATGSGKRNNWSLMTEQGFNLLNPTDLKKFSPSFDLLPVLVAAIVKAIGEYGNELRLGSGSGAPSTLISIHLGEDLTTFLDDYRHGKKNKFSPFANKFDIPAEMLFKFVVPHRDRNRTSTLIYGDNKLEFRGAGSSQHISSVNAVITASISKSFKDFADGLERGESIEAIVRAALNDNWHVVFNGNCYDAACREQVKNAGAWDIASNVEAICRITDPKNVAMYNEMTVLTSEECELRQNVKLQHYIGTIEIEALAMVDMVKKYIIPAVNSIETGPLQSLQECVQAITEKVAEIKRVDSHNLVKSAELSQQLRLDLMMKMRDACDDAESVVPANLWPLATYKELMFD